LALSSLIFEKTFKSEPVPDMTPEPQKSTSLKLVQVLCPEVTTVKYWNAEWNERKN
jgi:hypothetical protein